MLQTVRQDRAELIQVIRTTLLRRGEGVTGDPIRMVTQYWSTDGELLAEVDHWNGARAQADAISRNEAP